MDEVYTCMCKGQAWSIHDGFIKCLRCRKEYKFKRHKALREKEKQLLDSVTDFNKRVEQVKKDIAEDSKTEGGG